MSKILAIVFFGLTILSCSNPKNEGDDLKAINDLQAENDSLKSLLEREDSSAKNQMIRSLTFQDGNAETAMNFYIEVFDNSKVISVKRWGEGAPSEEGKIMQALFELDGNLFLVSDSPPVHDWGFTPAVANYIECENESELESLFSKLSENAKIMMPLDNYGFSQKFGFLEDQFGVSWQLNLE